MEDTRDSVNQKHLHSILFIGFLILILTIYLKSFPIIIIFFEFIIFTILQLYLPDYVLYTKQFIELSISTILFIFIFIVFYPHIYENVDVDNHLMIVLFYFNWYYITHLITNMLSGDLNTCSQYQ